MRATVKWPVLAFGVCALVLASCSAPSDGSATPVATGSAVPVVPGTDAGRYVTVEPTPLEATTSELPTSEATTPEAVIPGPVTTGPGDASLWTPTEIVDGDTIEVTGQGGDDTVRIVGINAPERGECFYEDATAALRFTLGASDVRLIRDVSDRDQYGRLLRYVELPDGVDAGAELVRAGFAHSYPFDPDTSRSGEYDALQAEAQAAQRGLWAPDACGGAVAPGASIAVEIEPNAPGDDNLNLNGEWVKFTNNGGAALDLTGWVVADNSSSHRYEFSNLVLAPGSSVTLYTGCGTDSPSERYWCNQDSAVWNNSGDTVYLRDPNGNTVVTKTYH